MIVKPSVWHWVLLGLVIGVLAWSMIHPHDYPTWFLEVVPVLIGVPLLLRTYRTFPMTFLVYCLLAGHAVLLMVGGHYTYAEVPLGFWMQDIFGFARNHYDRIGHFTQGFVPAILAREILIRRSPLKPGGWLFFLVTSVCLAFSASYELFEWFTAVVSKAGSQAFLGTQGDVWDTQWDMFFALIGSLTAQVTLHAWHDRLLARFDLV